MVGYGGAVGFFGGVAFFLQEFRLAPHMHQLFGKFAHFFGEQNIVKKEVGVEAFALVKRAVELLETLWQTEEKER